MGKTVKTVLITAALTAAALVAPAPAQAALGSTASLCVPGTPSCTSLPTRAVASGSGPSIFMNNIIWVGSTQSAAFWNSPDTVTVWQFAPLDAVLWAKPALPGLWTWFEGISRQSCFLGITTSLGGPYSTAGTYTHAYNHGGCSPTN